MADPGVSSQNFWRLLLGGANEGASVFNQDQSRAKAQAPDLFMALQNMMRQKQQRQEDVDFRERAFQTEQGQASAARARQDNIDIANQFQQMRENIMAQQRLKIQQQEADAMKVWREAQAKASGAKGGIDVTDQNAALKTMLASLENSPESYDILDEAIFSRLKPEQQAGYSKNVTQERDPDTNQLISVTKYRKMKPEAARKAYILNNVLSQIAGIAGPVMGPEAPGQTMDQSDDVDALLEYLPD